MTTYEPLDFDVLVIGAGGAGLRAAIEASAMGLKTGLVCKSLLGKAHTVMAEGGVAAALGNVDPQDTWEIHFKDTMLGGKMMNNWRMAQLHAQEAADRVYELERWGAAWDRTPDGQILQRAFGGHTHRRLAHVGDRTGLEMIRTLQDQGVHLGIDVFMECTVTRLLTDDGRVTGAFAYWRENGRFIVFRAKAIVLATGGIGKMYAVTSNSWEYTADGHALAYEAGAELIDMEFVQFHPTGMVWPPGVRGLLVTEAVRGEGGILKNATGERFMTRYDPERMELSTRDLVARAIYTEVKEGRGTPHGGVWLDISHRDPEFIIRKLPSMYHQFKDLASVDITKEPMEIGPTMHYVMGGIKVDADTGASTVPGLFAAGECAGGMHGANRLGGNSLSDLLVFGRRAGMGAAEFARQNPGRIGFDERQIAETERALLAPFDRPAGESPYAIQFTLQELMQTKVGIMRTASELEEAIAAFPVLWERMARMRVEGTRLYNPGWHLSWDLRNMLTIAEAVARSALQREESRGAHTRLDFPDTDKKKWENLTSVVCKRDGRMVVTAQPKPEMPPELKALFDVPLPPSTVQAAAANRP
jgi:succinate dehydrogenase / fumarate reductase flavoprotein subunit